MSLFKELLKRGSSNTSQSTVVFCGIVRDCALNLQRNISVIEKLGSCFKKYGVLIFENNSKDNTKKVLHRWALKNRNVKVFTNDFDESKYNSIAIPKGYSKYFSRRRIQRMADYRNLYLDYLVRNHIKADYLVVVDLDVTAIDIEGVVSSFGFEKPWDVMAANSKSLSPRLKSRYHDSYALVPDGHANVKQTLSSIKKNQQVWSRLKKNQPPIKVFSAFGGLAIYKWKAIKNVRYEVLDNKSGQVEVRCEHYSLHRQMIQNGHQNFYLNPNMLIRYQAVNFKLIVKKIGEILKVG